MSEGGRSRKAGKSGRPKVSPKDRIPIAIGTESPEAELEAERPKRKAGKNPEYENQHKEEENTNSAPDSYRIDIPNSALTKSELLNKCDIENPTPEIKQPLTTMEVHHHPEVEKKSLKEYVLEGLMIFLAVTMGFFAENLRETISDNQKIHEYMQSMVSDLQSDISLYRSSVDFNQKSAQMIDTIINSLTANKNNKAKVYFMARTLTIGASVIAPNAKTFEQMKSSGTIRLVSYQRIADSIASYYQWVKKFDYWSELQRQRLNDLLNSNDKIFNAAIFYSIIKEKRTSEKSVPELRDNPKLVSYDPVLINSVIMHYQYYYGILNIMNQHAIKASLQANKLIKLLKKEYNLENE